MSTPPMRTLVKLSPLRADGRVLIFLVAERHIAALLDRVPKPLFQDQRVHFLCIDDASSDGSADRAQCWVEANGARNVTVLRNPVNQGHGGNQKLGFRYAIDRGFDLTIVVQGDGRCAPELLPELIRVFDATTADVLLGARSRSVKEARRGATALPAPIGERLLTAFQNGVAGRALTDYHSGYRAYSTRFLESVPFESNSNGPRFDTELILQAFHVGARVEEFSIPALPGAVSGGAVKHAGEIMATMVQFKMHQMGMLCSLKYRDLDSNRYQDKTGMLYSSHRLALEIIAGLAPKTLLDLGSGPGYVARRCREMGIRVTGVDVSEPTSGSVHHFVAHDLEEPDLPLDPFEFDAVLMLDVIEHLANPEEFLISLRNKSRALRVGAPGSRIVLSTPNIAFAAVRANLALGRFNYAERGILDISHKRLFTRHSLLRMLTDCGYRIERVLPIGAPFEAVVEGGVGGVLGRRAQALADAWPTLFAFQFLVVATPLPSIQQILSQSEPRGSGAGEVGVSADDGQ